MNPFVPFAGRRLIMIEPIPRRVLEFTGSISPSGASIGVGTDPPQRVLREIIEYMNRSITRPMSEILSSSSIPPCVETAVPSIMLNISATSSIVCSHTIRHHHHASMKTVLKNFAYSVTASSDCRDAIKRLRSLERRLPSPPSRFAIPFVLKGRGFFRSIRPRQNPIEIEQMYRAICALRPRRVLEIGTAKGGTLYLWTQAATEDATLVSLDLPGGEFGGGYPLQRIPLYEAFAGPGQKLELLREDSHEEASLQAVRDRFNGESVDFAFIDGDHRYDGVRRDVAMYSPLVRPGGYLGFHDILPQEKSPETEVYRLWNELRQDHEVQEFIAHDSPRKIGIGLLRVPEGGLRIVDSAHEADISDSSDSTKLSNVAASE